MTLSDDLYTLIRDALPTDHSRQVTSAQLLEVVMRGLPPGRRVLDLGCGAGRSVDAFRAIDPTVDWQGLDVEGSPEARSRERVDASFTTYDGEHVPFADADFDVVYSHQVFEHVRYPERVLAEVARVLRPGGAFVGSVSSLEPYHSRSYWCFTPFGWFTLLADAGLRPLELRAGIDGPALIERAYRGRPRDADAWVERSPLNDDIDRWGRESGRRTALINLRKVAYAGHLVFRAARP